MTARGSSRRRRGVSGDAWRTRLWPLPTAGVGVAALLGVGLPLVDARVIGGLPAKVTAFLFSGGPEAARTVLSVIAGSLITVTSLTFSLTVVTLQLASSQYSPRLLRTFAQDRFVHVTLALLLSTFTYSVTVLRTVRASLDDQTAFVPQLSVTVAYLLALASVVGLVVFLAHLARQIRVESLLHSVHAEAVETMRRCTDAKEQPAASTPVTPVTGTVSLCAASSGFLTSVDEAALLGAAVDAGAVVVLDRLPGDSLIAGTPIAVAWPLAGTATLDRRAVTVLSERVADAVRTGFERTAAQDMAFGLRQIVDVAVKALSPGINDPTTAVHALSHASALLCEAAGRDLGPLLLRDGSGRVRVVLRRPDLPALIDLAVSQPRRYGAADPEVMGRLFTLLREVAWSTHRTEHRAALNEQLVRLCATVERQAYDDAERSRMDALARSVREAVDERWPPSDS
ncbi:hypothetical protein GCM10010126_69050 [Planomonospora parontospora]|uniref:DUF2254 domain-containing protein n=1 Tax=Planomonospora parontospora TaxID=58119 RepID=A0AA37F8P9_9ACTN|nr:DUF2254 domain-containing protein [Planomonospora parontospora]GGK99638.1 hypothetical protein GCM10010126_69050 [Planomonospora parontospora]